MARRRTTGTRMRKPHARLAGARRNLTRTAAEVRDDIQHRAGDLRNAVQAGAGDIWDGVKQVGVEARHRAVGELEDMRDTAAGYVGQGRDKARDLGEVLEDQIRNRPVAALLTAAGCGFLFGAIWRRR